MFGLAVMVCLAGVAECGTEVDLVEALRQSGVIIFRNEEGHVTRLQFSGVQTTDSELVCVKS